MTRYCDVCGRGVGVAGGIANLWVFGGHSKTEGLTLEFESDDTEHFLCYACIERLPDDPTAEDVAALRAAHDEEE
ncbi:MAG: hypothetical protein ABEJ42_03075 [Halobacteriaceae archaeon]